MMSKYLLGRKVHIEKKRVHLMRQWCQEEADRGELDEHFIDSSAACKPLFCVQAQLSLIGRVVFPDTCSGTRAAGAPANIPLLQTRM